MILWVLARAERQQFLAQMSALAEVAIVAKAVSMGLLVMLLLGSASTLEITLTSLVVTWGSTVAVVLLTRAVLDQAQIAGRSQRVLVIGGEGIEVRNAFDLLTTYEASGLDACGFVTDRQVVADVDLGEAWLGTAAELPDLLIRHQVTGAVVVSVGMSSDRLDEIFTVLRDFEVRTLLTVATTPTATSVIRPAAIGAEPALQLCWPRPSLFYRRVARLFDLVGATLLLLVTLPVSIAVAAAIKMEDGGPIIYRSKRVGVDRSDFEMLKFRSMRTDADRRKAELAAENERTGPLFKMTHDPRVTRIGRVIRETSIDEIPQFLNVLRGEMSLVGPRPALVEEAEVFDDELANRFSVVPGVTGLWQVEARANPHFVAYRSLDLRYMANRSIRMYLEILVLTAIQTLAQVVVVMLPRRSSDSPSEEIDLTTPIDLRDPAESSPDPSVDGTTASPNLA